MNLILLYGPPAVGKLTIAKELQKKMNYKLFHNHLFLNPIVEIFGYNHPAQKQLEGEFFFRVIEEAAKANINLIVTSGRTGSERNAFYQKMIEIINKNGGNCYLVQLTVPKKILMSRLNNESRKQQNKFTVQEEFEKFYNKHPEILNAIPFKDNLKIDTNKTTVEEAVNQIIIYYKF